VERPRCWSSDRWISGARAFRLELTDVVVESAQQSGAADSLVDSVSLAFRKVKWTYTDGGGSTSEGWDVAANTSIP